MAVNAAEPLGQARQVTLVDPLALIRPVEPDGRPAHYPRLPLQPALFEGRHITVVTETKGGHTPGTTIAEGCRVTKRAPKAVVMGGVDREGFYRLLSERLGRRKGGVELLDHAGFLRDQQ